MIQWYNEDWYTALKVSEASHHDASLHGSEELITLFVCCQKQMPAPKESVDQGGSSLCECPHRDPRVQEAKGAHAYTVFHGPLHPSGISKHWHIHLFRLVAWTNSRIRWTSKRCQCEIGYWAYPPYHNLCLLEASAWRHLHKATVTYVIFFFQKNRALHVLLVRCCTSTSLNVWLQDLQLGVGDTHDTFLFVLDVSH